MTLFDDANETLSELGMPGRVHPQLGADELLLRLNDWSHKPGGFTSFTSEVVWLSLNLPPKLCSNTLGRLFRRGDLTRRKNARIDKHGKFRGICYTYSISSKGQSRLGYLKRRQSPYLRLTALAGNVGEAFGQLGRGVLLDRDLKTHLGRLFLEDPLLASFSLIDPEFRNALPHLGAGVSQSCLAFPILSHLQKRGLVPIEDPIVTIGAGRKLARLSNLEIITNALFKGVLLLKKDNDGLKADLENKRRDYDCLKERYEKVLEIANEVMHTAKTWLITVNM